MKHIWLGFAALMALAFFAQIGPAHAVNGVTAGDFVVERPTLLSLGFEWKITGDDNRNSSVAVSFRKKGESAWRKGMPLMRMGGEFVSGPMPQHGDRVNYYNYTVPHGFAGSILSLEPDTEYECRFVLSDPDGVAGQVEQTATVRTRKVPRPAEGGNVYHVYPWDKDQKTLRKNEFIGLLAAYYVGADQSDHHNIFPVRVKPGDTILVHAGVYKDRRFHYGGQSGDRAGASYGTSFDGTYYLTAKGTADKPIVIKSAGDGEVIFDGDGNDTLFNLLAGDYHYFDGITVRNTNVGFLLGIKDIIGATGFTLVNSRFDNIGRGVRQDWHKSQDFYIADNVFLGRHNPERVVSWINRDFWGKYGEYPALVDSEYAVKVYGQGHVVAYNYIANFHDGVTHATFGNPHEGPREYAASVDFYGNDIFNISDNCIELDGGVHNMRAFENRCVNATQPAYSTQPIFGGPAYVYRNLVYNSTTGGGLKLLDRPSGVLVYNNTFVGTGGSLGPLSNVHFLNNLIVGDSWKRPIFQMKTLTPYSSSDHNGFGLNPVDGNFAWESGPFTAANGGQVRQSFNTLSEFQKGTGQDLNSITVTRDVFRNVKPTDQANPLPLYSPEDNDFRLRPRSAAVDKGIELPGITDGFKGRAPDLGAYEFDQPVPQYGPRVWPVGDAPSKRRSETGPPRGR